MRNEDGFVLPFIAILLMVLFLVGAIILDVGSFYLRHGELQPLVKQSANAGMLKFSDAMEIKAEENKSAQCMVEEPPAVCSSENMFDFLTSGEVVDLVGSPTVQEAVSDASISFLITYDPQLIIGNEDIQITFPYEYEGVFELQIQVIVSDTPQRFLGGIFPVTDDEIQVHAISYIATPF